MEILRPGPSTTETELAGTASLPDLIKVATNTPGRAIDPRISLIKLDRSRDFSAIKNAGYYDNEDKVAKFHLNGGDLYTSPINIFSPHENRNTIFVPPEERIKDPTNNKATLPKRESIGMLVQYSVTDTLPSPNNLRHLLLEDNNYDSATAAFFLTSRDKLYGIFRTSEAPQLSRREVDAAIEDLIRLQAKYLEANRGMDLVSAKSQTLEDAINKYKLRFFSGMLNTLKLRAGPPVKITF